MSSSVENINKSGNLEDVPQFNTPICRMCCDDNTKDLIQPCACKGSMAYVHEKCLKIWIKAIQNKDCSVCQKEYDIIFDLE